MIKDIARWQAFEDDERRCTPVDFQRNLRVFDAMLHHARALGKFELESAADSLPAKIALAKVLNAAGPARPPRARS